VRCEVEKILYYSLDLPLPSRCAMIKQVVFAIGHQTLDPTILVSAHHFPLLLPEVYYTQLEMLSIRKLLDVYIDLHRHFRHVKHSSTWTPSTRPTLDLVRTH
jgi:hypothetical protein